MIILSIVASSLSARHLPLLLLLLLLLSLTVTVSVATTAGISLPVRPPIDRETGPQPTTNPCASLSSVESYLRLSTANCCRRHPTYRTSPPTPLTPLTPLRFPSRNVLVGVTMKEQALRPPHCFLEEEEMMANCNYLLLTPDRFLLRPPRCFLEEEEEMANYSLLSPDPFLLRAPRCLLEEEEEME